jgi:predicted TIM-barrel fold metal-dependent hydrolase
VLVDSAQITTDEIYTFCKNYPGVKLIICRPAYRGGRLFDALLKACPNLYLESSNYCAHNGIADVCRKFGAQRIVFGSGIPDGAATSAVSLIRYANISEEEKQLIASGNILSMLEEVRL